MISYRRFTLRIFFKQAMERRARTWINNRFIHKISSPLLSLFKAPLISSQARKRALIPLTFTILLEIARAHIMSLRQVTTLSQRTRHLKLLEVLSYLVECLLTLKNYFKTPKDI